MRPFQKFTNVQGRHTKNSKVRRQFISPKFAPKISNIVIPSTIIDSDQIIHKLRLFSGYITGFRHSATFIVNTHLTTTIHMVSRFLYIPNLIGYSRVALMFLAYSVYDTHPLVYVFAYAASQFLDMFDGWAARKYNQATKFGAMLDMVTDRCSGIGLMLTLAQLYPEYTLVWHCIIWLDIFSHWCHMLAQLSSGSQSHKLVTSGPALLQIYYRVHWFMVLLIFGAEGFPLYIYLRAHEWYVDWMFAPVCDLFGLLFFPLFVTKHVINVIQFTTAAASLDKPKEKAK